MHWAIKKKDKRNPKHCLYIVFMTAATYFAADVIMTRAGYNAVWRNSRMLCSATESDSDWKDALPSFGMFHLTV